MPRRRLPLAFAAAGAFLPLVSGAPAAPGDTFTAMSTPSQVQRSKAVTYTMTFTNTSTNESSSSQADRATITAPEGFEIEGSVAASASAAAPCEASQWDANVGGAKREITLRDPDDEGNQRLCRGATLTVVFTATASTDGTFTWELSLSRGNSEEGP